MLKRALITDFLLITTLIFIPSFTAYTKTKAKTCAMVVGTVLGKTKFGIRPVKVDDRTGEIEAEVTFYLPSYSVEKDSSVYFKNYGKWPWNKNRKIKMEFNQTTQLWTVSVKKLKPGSIYQFYYKNVQGKIVEVSDPNAIEYTKNMMDLHLDLTNKQRFKWYPDGRYTIQVGATALDSSLTNYPILFRIQIPVISYEKTALFEVDLGLIVGENISWQKMSYSESHAFWEIESEVSAKTLYFYRYRKKKNSIVESKTITFRKWEYYMDQRPYSTVLSNHRTAGLPGLLMGREIPLTPEARQLLKSIKVFDFLSIVSDYRGLKDVERGTITKPFVILDVPLENVVRDLGLLDSNKSIARVLIDSGLIPYIRDKFQINAWQAVIQISVNDRKNPTWQYDYLGPFPQNPSAIDTDIGSLAEVRELISELDKYGITFIPDIVSVIMVKNSSLRTPDNIIDKNGKRVYTDEDPLLKKHRDFGGYMNNLTDPILRAQVAQNISRLGPLWGVKTDRFDFVDGLRMQNKNRPLTSGETSADELLTDEIYTVKQKLDSKRVSIGEAFELESVGNPANKKLFTITYESWVALTMLEGYQDNFTKKSLLNIYEALDTLTSSEMKNKLASISNHDFQQPDLTRPNMEGVGTHLAQYFKDMAQKRGGVVGEDLLKFIGHKVISTELLTMFSSNMFYLTTLHLFSLGDLAAPNNDFKIHAGAINNPDLQKWIELTGLSKKSVVSIIDQLEQRWARAREIFIEKTDVEHIGNKLKSYLKMEVQKAGSNIPVFSITRQNTLNPNSSMIVIFNLDNIDLDSFEIKVPIDGEWGVRWDLFDNAVVGDSLGSSDKGKINVKVKAGNIRILEYYEK